MRCMFLKDGRNFIVLSASAFATDNYQKTYIVALQEIMKRNFQNFQINVSHKRVIGIYVSQTFKFNQNTMRNHIPYMHCMSLPAACDTVCKYCACGISKQIAEIDSKITKEALGMLF